MCVGKLEWWSNGGRMVIEWWSNARPEREPQERMTDPELVKKKKSSDERRTRIGSWMKCKDVGKGGEG